MVTTLTLARTRDGRPILWQADLDQWDPSPKRSGGRLRYRCPLHDSDHQPSFSLEPDSGRYTCHACGEKGTLRDFWPDKGGAASRRTPAPSFEEKGRREAERAARAEQERIARLAADLPIAASAFLAGMGPMSAALQDPTCPGAVYLRARGLDPVPAATLGVGYAPPNTWPGDRYENDGRGLRNGRIVYPLYDPCTGRVVSAVARLCLDTSPSWSATVREEFKGIKQRKLKGCPAGVWPYKGITAARDTHHPLAFVEGPADALALLQHGELPCEVVALIGTANVLPMASLAGIGGAILALDMDGGGIGGTRKLIIELALAGIPSEVMAAGWLGTSEAKDLGGLAQLAVTDAAAAAACYDQALTALQAACGRVMMPPPPLVQAASTTPVAPAGVTPEPKINTCLWCGRWSPGGVCCDDCRVA